MAAEVSLMRIGRQIMDVAFGVSAPMEGSSSTNEARRGLPQYSRVVRCVETSPVTGKPSGHDSFTPLEST